MTSGHGGARKGAGRKCGSATQKTREIADRAAAEGITPLEVMLEAMRFHHDVAARELAKGDEMDVERAGKAMTEAREAAKDAAPYVHPRLSNIEANVSVTGHEAALDELE